MVTEFIMDALKARTNPNFRLTKLINVKIDHACQFVLSSLWISKNVRRDVIVHLCFSGPSSPPKTISFYGGKIKGLRPTEQDIAKAIRKALEIGLELKLGEEKQASDGIIISKQSIERLVKSKKNIYYLNKKGEDIRKIKLLKNRVFVIGDYIGVPRNTERLLKNIGAKKLSLGPQMIFAAHCPIIINNELDRRI
jgi:tRNA (pseudouridine54-N1)-methyltransferase